MAALQSMPRFLLPRGPLLLRPQARAVLPLPSPASVRHASITPKGLSEEFRRRREAQQQKGAPVIPQPDKYRPPSHSKRAPNRNLENKIYGPPLSAEDMKRMATKKYPNMMSPEGTFSYWLLNSRMFHAWLTLSLLVSLAGSAWYMDFMAKTIYAHLLPTRKDFLRHPFEASGRFIEVYKMHVAQTTEKYNQQMLRKREEVEKRRMFRLERQKEAEEKGEEYVVDPRYYVAEDGIRRRRVKRWFGIWE